MTVPLLRVSQGFHLHHVASLPSSCLGGESQSHCAHQHSERAEERTQFRPEVSGYRDLNTALKPDICSEHDKTKRCSDEISSLTKSLLFKKPFGDHIGITWVRKMSSLGRKYRENDCCIVKIIGLSFK